MSTNNLEKYHITLNVIITLLLVLTWGVFGFEFYGIKKEQMEDEKIHPILQQEFESIHGKIIILEQQLKDIEKNIADNKIKNN